MTYSTAVHVIHIYVNSMVKVNVLKGMIRKTCHLCTDSGGQNRRNIKLYEMS